MNKIIWAIKKRLLPRIYIEIILIFLLIISIYIPLMSKRYLLLLDHTPIINSYRLSNFFYGRDVSMFGGYLPIDIMSTTINVFQKILPFLLLFLIWYSIYGLSYNTNQSRISRSYMVLLYIINPFTYTRFLSGQWYILFAYAIIPLSIKSFIELLENNDNKNKIKFIILVSIVAFSIHMLIIAFIIFLVIGLLWIWKYKEKIKFNISTIIVFIFLNSYWIIPIITAKNIIADNIGDKDLEIYAAKGLFEIAAMYGFWREGYIYTKDILPGWQILYLIILSLAIIGVLAYYKDEKIGFIVKAMVVIGIVGFILASGIKGPFGDQIYWLFDNTLLKGFRDSQKFVAMLVLSYSILGGLGIAKLESMKK